MKNWIKKILGITRRELRFQDLENSNKRLWNKIAELETSHQMIKSLHEQFVVAVDFSMRPDESWAVVALKGHPEQVRFVDLRGKDTRQIVAFLRQFDRKNVRFDGPFGVTDMIRYELDR